MKSVGQNFHRISRMNQRQSCLSDYSRICADIWPLANGSHPICAAIVFGHADFADDADFSSWEGLVPQISQIYTDFSSWDYFCPTDFTDIHRFFWISGESLYPISEGICNDRTGRLCENPWVITAAGNLRINSVSSYEKNLRHLRNLRDQKKLRWWKNLCISVKSVGQKNNITGPQCSYFVRPSSPNVLS